MRGHFIPSVPAETAQHWTMTRSQHAARGREVESTRQAVTDARHNPPRQLGKRDPAWLKSLKVAAKTWKPAMKVTTGP